VNRRNPELLGRIKDKFGFARSTTDWREVIAERPDIVVVGSPPGYHFEQAKAALEAGAHVMCEKPFTIDPADAWELDATVKRTGRQLFIAYGWNYRPMVIQAHRMMHEDGGIGDIEHVAMHMDSVTRELLSETGDYPGADPEAIPQPDTWSRPETSGGGYGQAQLTHLLGVALWLTDLRGQAARPHVRPHGRQGGAP
jgi:predicted dehydrogenase